MSENDSMNNYRDGIYRGNFRDGSFTESALRETEFIDIHIDLQKLEGKKIDRKTI